MKLFTPRTRTPASLKIAIACILAIVIAYIGYASYSNYKAAREEKVSTKAESVQAAPAITQPSDLDKAASAIDQVEVDSDNIDDLDEIESELSAF
jgi:hypothetical protein